MFKTTCPRLHVQDYIFKATCSKVKTPTCLILQLSQHIVLPELSVLQGEYCGHVEGLYDLLETLPSTSINIDTNPNLNK